ncbi:DUF6638 family protein [Vibrio owensii]|uniref:DUF6638 family protein n=1 Tax=Vibrio harveyi group TaxID=717610 RepID=UPI003CC598C2
MPSTEKLGQIINAELLFINTPHMIERYNRALLGLTGKVTALSSFHIDCSGFSPEIAREFGDFNYLNPNGVNRQFILIDIKQENLGLYQSYFSSTSQIIKSFFADNRNALLTLTALDSVYGELENNIYKIESIDDLLNVGSVEVKIETPRRIIEQAKLLKGKINDLKASPDMAWLEDDKLLEIANLARKTGNITMNEIIPEVTVYDKDWFYTAHFGGIYILRTSKVNVIIDMGGTLKNWSNPDYRVIDGSDHQEVYKFLLKSKIIQKLKGQELQDKKESIKNKRYQVILDHLSTSEGLHHTEIDWFTIKQFIYENYNTLPQEFHELFKLSQQVEKEEAVPSEGEMAFYVSKLNRRLMNEQKAAVINHLLANYTDLSYLRMFKFNRELFLEKFEKWPESKKDYIVEYLSSHIQYIENLKNL